MENLDIHLSDIYVLLTMYGDNVTKNNCHNSYFPFSLYYKYG